MSFKGVFPFLTTNLRSYKQKRLIATKVRWTAELVSGVEDSLSSEAIKPRQHPGRIKAPTCSLPKEIKTAMLKELGDYPVKKLIQEGEKLNRYLMARQAPIEKNDLRDKTDEIRREVKQQFSTVYDVEAMTEEQSQHYSQLIKSRVNTLLHQQVYHWHPLELSDVSSRVYMVSRSAAEYAALIRVFKEIKQRDDPKNEPKTLLDFGSGVGTVAWAAYQTWGKSIKEYFNVDPSKSMNDLASNILQHVDYFPQMKGIFYRQFLPSSTEIKYDIVVSAYSLFELPDSVSRLHVLTTLWNKANRFLVLIERGSNAGFKLLNEARDYILLNSTKDDKLSAHVFAPCPHELDCPRRMEDNTPCNFLVPYLSFPQKEDVHHELFSYLILQKGGRDPSDEQWPRIVRPVLRKSKHSICRMCTGSGQLQEIIFTASKHGRSTYRCARSSKWGDLLPVNLKTVTTENPESLKSSEDKKETL